MQHFEPGKTPNDSARSRRAFTITHLEYLQRSQQAIRAWAGDSPGASKRVAQALECNERTALNYLEGKCVPSGLHDLRALHAIPHYAAMKSEIAEMQMTLHPLFQAKLADLVRFVQQHGERVFGGE